MIFRKDGSDTFVPKSCNAKLHNNGLTKRENGLSLQSKKQKKKMDKKNSNMILWIGCCLSLCCSIVLFIMLLSGKNTDKAEAKEVETTVKSNKTLSSGALKVAYVDTDSVLAKYEMAKDMEESLKAYQKKVENEFAAKQKKFENDYANYMKNGASLTLTQQKQTEKELQQRGNELQQLQPKLMAQLQERQASDNKKLLDAVYAFIKDYNKKHQNFDIILAKSYIGSPVLYIDKGMDLTDVIIKGLNEEYKEYKKKD